MPGKIGVVSDEKKTARVSSLELDNAVLIIRRGASYGVRGRSQSFK